MDGNPRTVQNSKRIKEVREGEKYVETVSITKGYLMDIATQNFVAATKSQIIMEYRLFTTILARTSKRRSR